MARIKVTEIMRLLDEAERILRHPLTRSTLRAVLPQLGVSSEDLAALDRRHADLQARKARAGTRTRKTGR